LNFVGWSLTLNRVSALRETLRLRRARARRSRAAGKLRTGAPSAEALLLRARKDRSAKLQALLNRKAEDCEWLARRLNVT